jgi:hypothetical protein
VLAPSLFPSLLSFPRCLCSDDAQRARPSVSMRANALRCVVSILVHPVVTAG